MASRDLMAVLSARYTFRLESHQQTRSFPSKIIIGQKTTETTAHVMLKFLGYVLFHRERIQVETNLHLDHIPFTPDLAQLDYELRPVLWVECGDCSVAKLNKLAVKVPEAEIWVIKKSPAEADHLYQDMEKHGLRRNRYGLIALDQDMFNEMESLLNARNQFTWYKGALDPPFLQFDFNSLWFDVTFTVMKF